MASPFADAITQSMIAGLDPMNGVVKQYANQQVARADLDLDQERIKTMQLLEQLIAKAKDNDNDGVVVEAYRRMLNKYAAA
jgi:hypothetical protein